MRAALDDAAVVEDEDGVRVRDRRKAVRDDEHRAPREEAIDGLLHETLGLGVERRRRLVEDENRRVDEQRPRDGEALPLAAGEARAALAEDGVVAVGAP